MTFDLPDFTTPQTIEPTNIEALGVVYAAFELEQLRIFEVVDRLVELSQSGHLPLGAQAGPMVSAWARARGDRLTSAERQQIYCRALGLACAPAGDPAPNLEFNQLWTRFLSAVSAYVRALRISNTRPAQTVVRSAARDLASNLSGHGYGIGHFTARALQRQLADAVSLLSASEVRSAFGARDMWQVIDQVAQNELGGARQTARYRTRASAGTVIMRWLAQRAPTFGSTSTTAVLDTALLVKEVPTPAPPRLTSAPTDLDLVNACEQWLAFAVDPAGTEPE